MGLLGLVWSLAVWRGVRMGLILLVRRIVVRWDVEGGLDGEIGEGIEGTCYEV